MSANRTLIVWIDEFFINYIWIFILDVQIIFDSSSCVFQFVRHDFLIHFAETHQSLSTHPLLSVHSKSSVVHLFQSRDSLTRCHVCKCEAAEINTALAEKQRSCNQDHTDV